VAPKRKRASSGRVPEQALENFAPAAGIGTISVPFDVGRGGAGADTPGSVDERLVAEKGAHISHE
jgi:hypothetical protein